MKAYFEPKMNISAFDKADVITTSGGAISNQLNDNQNFGKASYNAIKNGLDSVSANTKMGG